MWNAISTSLLHSSYSMLVDIIFLDWTADADAMLQQL